MRAMRMVSALLTIVAFSCATRPQGPTCVDLSGSYALAEQPVRNGTGSAAFVFGDGLSLVRIDRLTIAQPGCRIELRVSGDGGKSHDAVFENDLEWSDDGVSATWTPAKTGSAILAGASSRTRTLTMRLSPRRDLLTISSQFDERGLALLFMPFHDHGEATCVMKRVAENQDSRPASPRN